MVVRLLFSNLSSTPGQQLITSADSIKGGVIYVAQKNKVSKATFQIFTETLYPRMLGEFTGKIYRLFRGVHYLHF